MIERLIVWPIKAVAWALIFVAFFITARRNDSLRTWTEREFLP